MILRTLLILILGMFSYVSAAEIQFPPVPAWKPEFYPSNELLMDKMIFYTNEQKDLVQFKYGTIVIIPDGLADADSHIFSKKVLSDILNFHPDMNPMPMEDGNLVIQYNHPAYNVVLSAFVEKHMDKIRKHHLEGLATDEVLITPSGNNVFDEFGMKALYGRTFMFMDAQNPKVFDVYRH